MNVKAVALDVGIASLSGSDLVARARRGDLDAFEQIIRSHERNIFRLAWRLLGNVDDAADVEQEVFLKLYRSLHSVDEARDVGPWLYRVTVNAAHDLRRRRRPAGAADEPVATGPTPEQSVAAEERQALLRRALGALPAKERAALVLRDLEGLTTAEVAAALGSTEPTVRSQISSARVRLKRILERMLSRRMS